MYKRERRKPLLFLLQFVKNLTKSDLDVIRLNLFLGTSKPIYLDFLAVLWYNGSIEVGQTHPKFYII